MGKYKQEYGEIMNLFNNFDFIYQNTNELIINKNPQNPLIFLLPCGYSQISESRADRPTF